MYIAPNTIIKILKDVPLDPTYDHTIYWTNIDGDDSQHTYAKAAQATYFSSKAKYTLTNQSYQRLQRGWMSVRIKADDLYDCNYIMFQNTSYGNKWFYAFLKTVEYKNDNVSEIEFEIDDMQTWWFDYNLEVCFVEREHTITDGLFENIVYEDLEIGDEMVCNSLDSFDMNTMLVCVFINRQPQGSTLPSTSLIINNVYTPVRIADCIPLQASYIDAVLNAYTENDIVAVFEYPAFMAQENPNYDPSLPYGPSNQPYYSPSILQRRTKTITPNFSYIDAPIDSQGQGGYVPVNKKLWSYPYNYLMVTNNCGASNIYHWDNFQGLSHGGATFEISGTYISIPVAMCYPTMYKGLHYAYEEAISYTNFPQCAWSGDAFKAWWAQNKNSYVTGIVSTIANGVSGGVSAAGNFMLSNFFAALSGPMAPIMSVTSMTKGITGLFDSVVSTGTGIANLVAKKEDMKHAPNKTFGQAQCDCLNAGLRRIQFDFYQMSIKKEYAKIIDDYFTRYGYACRENKIPNRNARPHWTYTKTVGCTITGSIPADSSRNICKIYDKGITFWNAPSEIGNYSLDNTPVIQ